MESFKTEEPLSPAQEYIRLSGFVTWQVADQDGADCDEWIAQEQGGNRTAKANSEIEAVSKLNLRRGKNCFDLWRKGGKL